MSDGSFWQRQRAEREANYRKTLETIAKGACRGCREGFVAVCSHSYAARLALGVPEAEASDEKRYRAWLASEVEARKRGAL